MTGILHISVPGKPQPQGSVRAFVPTTKNGQPVRRADGSIVVNLTSDNPALKAWRDLIADYAHTNGGRVQEVGVCVEATFFLQRPLSHYGTGRNAAVLKDSAPTHPLVRPDVDKLLRAVLDALTGVLWVDDSQVVEVTGRKRFADGGTEPRVEIVAFLPVPADQLVLA